jgi:hypothetical protein
MPSDPTWFQSKESARPKNVFLNSVLGQETSLTIEVLSIVPELVHQLCVDLCHFRHHLQLPVHAIQSFPHESLARWALAGRSYQTLIASELVDRWCCTSRCQRVHELHHPLCRPLWLVSVESASLQASKNLFIQTGLWFSLAPLTSFEITLSRTICASVDSMARYSPILLYDVASVSELRAFSS